MSEFKIKPQRVRSAAQDMNSIARQMKHLEEQIRDIQRGLSFEVAQKQRIRQRLRQAGSDVEAQYRGISNSVSVLDSITRTYEETESQLAGASVDSSMGRNEIAWAGVIEADPSLDFLNIKADPGEKIWDMIYKSVIAAAGPFGTVVDAFKNGFGGNHGNVLKDLIKLAGGYVKNSDKSGIKWGDWFGIEPSTKGPWEGALGKYKDFSSVRKGFSTVCNWASAIVSSGFSNYGEHGNFGARFWEETAVESLLNIGEGILIGAGTAAAFAAAGISAPALVVGAAAAGITVAVDWGLDAIVSWATKGAQTRWKEAVSDTFCNVYENVAGWAKDTAQKASARVKDTGEKISNAVSSGINGIKNAIQNVAGSTCSWGVFSFS